VLKELINGKGGLYDPAVVETCVKVVDAGFSFGRNSMND